MMRRWEKSLALAAGLLLLSACEQRQRKGAWTPPTAGTYLLSSIPLHEPVEKPEHLNKYYVRITQEEPITFDVEVYRSSASVSTPTYLGTLSPQSPEVRDTAVTVNSPYEYSFSVRGLDGSLRELKHLPYLILPDVVLQGEQTDPIKKYNLEPANPRIRATRLFLKRNLFYWTWGKGLTLEAERLIVEDGAAVGVVRPDQDRYEPDPLRANLDRNPGAFVIRAKSAKGTLRIFPAFPLLPPFNGANRTDAPVGKSSASEKIDLKEEARKNGQTYTTVLAQVPSDPDDKIRGNQETRLYISEESPFEVKVGFPSLEDMAKRIPDWYLFRNISVHNGDRSEVFTFNRFQPTANWKGIVSGRFDGPRDEASFIDSTKLHFHLVTSPLHGKVFALIEMRVEENLSVWKIGDYDKADGLSTLAYMKYPEFLSLAVENRTPPTNKVVITPYEKTKDPSPVLRDLNRFFVAVDQLQSEMRKKGLWVDLEIAPNPDESVAPNFTRAIETAEALLLHTPELLDYCRFYKLHSVLLSTSKSRQVKLEDGTLVLPQDSVMSPQQIMGILQTKELPFR